MTTSAFDSGFNRSAENTPPPETPQPGLHQTLTTADFTKAKPHANNSLALEQQGVLPPLKLDGTDKANQAPLASDKAIGQLVQGLLENKPEVLAKAASQLKDGDYNVGAMIGRLEKSGLLHVDKEHKELLNGLQTVSKHGDHFEVTRNDTATEHAPGGYDIKIDKDIQFDLQGGQNPSIKNIQGLEITGITGVSLDEVDALKNNHGSYDYKISHGDVMLGLGSGDVLIKT